MHFGQEIVSQSKDDLVTTCNYCSISFHIAATPQGRLLGLPWGQSAHSVQLIPPLLSTQLHDHGRWEQDPGLRVCKLQHPLFLRCRHYEQQGRRFWSQRPDMQPQFLERYPLVLNIVVLWKGCGMGKWLFGCFPTLFDPLGRFEKTLDGWWFVSLPGWGTVRSHWAI